MSDTVRCWCCGEWCRPARPGAHWCQWCVDECTNEGCVKTPSIPPDAWERARKRLADLAPLEDTT